MQVVVKKHVLDQMIRTLAEERSYHSRKNNQIAGDDRPVLPDAQMAMQLSTEQIPVGNPDFLPVNKKQAAAAAAQMTAQVDPDKLQKYFAGLKKLIRKTATVEKYKGMSETDLFEALRPMVLAEAEDEMVNGVIKVFKSNPKQWDYVKKQFDNLVANFEDDPFRLKDKYRGWEQRDFETLIAAMKNTAWSAPQQPRQPRQPKEDEKSVESPTVKPGEKKTSRLAARAAEIEADADAKAAKRAARNSAAGDVILNADERRDKDIIDNNLHISLDDVIKADIARVLDAITKSKLPVPASLAETGIQINVIQSKVSETNSKARRYAGADIRTINFNLSRLKKGYASAGLKIEKIIHMGGPIPVWKEDDTRGVYYMTDPFPFDENEYKRRFDALFPSIAGSFVPKSVRVARDKTYAAEKSVRRSEDKEMAAASAAARSATMQKELSVADAKERALEIMEELEDLKLKNDLNSISDELSRLKIGDVTPTDFIKMDTEQKISLTNKITKALIDNRSSFYTISHMDYARDILDAEKFESEYTKDETGEMFTTEPASVGEQLLLETFFDKCFKVLTQRALDRLTSDENMPEHKDTAKRVFKIENYDEFITSGINIDEWKELVKDVSKTAVLENQSLFIKTIPDFYKVYAGVKLRAGTDDYNERLAAIGMSDIGKLREPFEHIRSPIAFMKGVTTSAMLDILDLSAEEDEAEEDKNNYLAKLTSNPQGVKLGLKAYIDGAADNIVSANQVFTMLSKYLKSIGITNRYDLVISKSEDIVNALEANGSIEAIVKSSRKNPLKIEDIRSYIESVVKRFITVIGGYFLNLTKTPSISKRAPIYKFMESYAESMRAKAENTDAAAIELIDVFVDEYIPSVQSQVKKAQSDAKKAQGTKK